MEQVTKLTWEPPTIVSEDTFTQTALGCKDNPCLNLYGDSRASCDDCGFISA